MFDAAGGEFARRRHCFGAPFTVHFLRSAGNRHIDIETDIDAVVHAKLFAGASAHTHTAGLVWFTG